MNLSILLFSSSMIFFKCGRIFFLLKGLSNLKCIVGQPHFSMSAVVWCKLSLHNTKKIQLKKIKWIKIQIEFHNVSATPKSTVVVNVGEIEWILIVDYLAGCCWSSGWSSGWSSSWSSGLSFQVGWVNFKPIIFFVRSRKTGRQDTTWLTEEKQGK